jgi:hypothetical protein
MQLIKINKTAKYGRVPDTGLTSLPMDQPPGVFANATL